MVCVAGTQILLYFKFTIHKFSSSALQMYDMAIYMINSMATWERTRLYPTMLRMCDLHAWNDVLLGHRICDLTCVFIWCYYTIPYLKSNTAFSLWANFGSKFLLYTCNLLLKRDALPSDVININYSLHSWTNYIPIVLY